MKTKNLKAFTMLAGLLFAVQLARAQANYTLGAGPAVNTYGPTGFGALFQAQIKLTNSLAIVPSIGIENPYVGHIDATARYFFSPMAYVQGGGLFHIAGDGFEESGPGATVSLGFQLFTTKSQFFDINLHADYLGISKLPSGYSTPNPTTGQSLAGIRITYNFVLPKAPPGSRQHPPIIPRLF